MNNLAMKKKSKPRKFLKSIRNMTSLKRLSLFKIKMIWLKNMLLFYTMKPCFLKAEKSLIRKSLLENSMN